MQNIPITIFDGVFVAVILISSALAMFRGFVREVLSIAAWVGAAILAYMGYPMIAPFASGYIENDNIANIVSAVTVFLVTLVIISYITVRISDFVLDSRIGALDRTLGFVFGAARGVFLLSAGMLLFIWLVPAAQQPVWVASAKSKPVLEMIGRELVAWLPADIEEILFNNIDQRDGVPTAPPKAEVEEGSLTYSKDERRGLDRIIAANDRSL